MNKHRPDGEGGTSQRRESESQIRSNHRCARDLMLALALESAILLQETIGAKDHKVKSSPAECLCL